MNKSNEIEEYEFYKKQIQKAKFHGSNSIAVSVEFLDIALNHTDHLNIVVQASEGLRKAL